MKQIKRILSVVLILSLVITLAACSEKESTNTKDKGQVDSQSNKETDTATEGGSNVILTGEVTVSGSTSVEKIGNATGEEFAALNPGVTFTYEGIGSSAGVKNANDKVTNIGTASRSLKTSEEEYGLTVQVIAYDGIAVVVHPDNGIDGLSMEQLTQIYKGDITNWSEVGGVDEMIAVVSREDGSGTRGAFEELVDFEEALTADALLKDGNGNVQATVAQNPQAIGYVSFTYLDDSVKGIEIDGVLPTVDNVLNGSYPISRPFLMMYHEDNMTDASSAYIEFIMSKEGQDIVESKGGIRVD